MTFVSADLRTLTHYLTRLSENRQMLLLMALGGLVIFVGIGLRSPWPADEPRFAEVAREMVDSGQWLIPRRGGEYYPDKPPVFMWAIALFYWLTGNLKIAFLLPNALCGLATLALVYDLGRRLWNPLTGVTAAALLLLAPQFLIQAKNAQIDAMVACWITFACYGLVRHFFERPAWAWYFAAWGFMGLGIITKGVGFLPLLMFIPILILATKNRPLFTDALKPRCLAGPLVMVLVAAAWLIPMVLYVDHVGTDAALAYRDNILFRQTGERYANAWGHIQPWYYFLTDVIPGLWFPLPLLVLATWRSFIRSLKEQPAMFTLFVWVVLVVVFFSISPGKRGVYVLPALPMFALFVAALMDRAQNEHGHRPIARWLAPLITTLHAVAAMALILAGVMAWWDHPLLTEKVAGYTRDPALLHQAGSVVLAMGMVWLATLVGFWRSPPIHRWFVALMVGWMLFSTWGYTVLEPLRTPRNVLAEAERILPPDAELGLIHFSEQFILFSKLDVTHFSYLTSNQEQERNAWRWMKEGEERYLLVENDLQLACFDFNGQQTFGHCPPRTLGYSGPKPAKAGL